MPALLLGISPNLHSASALGGRLESGPYTAGFQLTCRYDFSRLYAPPYSDGKDSRSAKRFHPIVQASWYPAQASGNTPPMRYWDYFIMQGISPESHDSLTRLFRFNPDFVSQGAWLCRIRRALAGESAQGERVWATYEAVCLCAHRFLDAALKQDTAASVSLEEMARSAGDGNSAIVLRIENALPPPPAPHHLIEFMLSDGAATLTAFC